MKVNKGQAPLNGCCTLLTPGVPPLLKSIPSGMSDNNKEPDALLALMVMRRAGRVLCLVILALSSYLIPTKTPTRKQSLGQDCPQAHLLPTAQPAPSDVCRLCSSSQRTGDKLGPKDMQLACVGGGLAMTMTASNVRPWPMLCVTSSEHAVSQCP